MTYDGDAYSALNFTEEKMKGETLEIYTASLFLFEMKPVVDWAARFINELSSSQNSSPKRSFMPS